MEQELTPEQKEYLETWAGKRDTLASEVSSLQSQKEKLELALQDAAQSYSDIETRFNQIIGRIVELNKKEAERAPLILKEVANLESQKTALESEINNLSKIVDVLSVQKKSLENDVSLALSTFNVVKGETILLDKVVERVTKFSEQNSNDVNILVQNLKNSLSGLVDINQKNVTETNKVLEKLPKMLMELQKAKLITNKSL